MNICLSIQFLEFGLFSGSTCTGSVISKDVILTAAHCVEKHVKEAHFISSYTMVILGHCNSSAVQAIRIGVKSILIHPNFHRKNSDEGGINLNDIALLRLESNLEFNAAVQFITLPGQNHTDEDSMDPMKTQLVFAGWGESESENIDEEGKRLFADYLENCNLCTAAPESWKTNPN